MSISELRGYGLDRRRFLQGSAAALAAAVGLARPGGAAGGPGGRFRLGMVEGQTTDVLDPQLAGTMFMAHLNFQLMNCLVEISPDFEAIPELAEQFEPRDGARKWAFKLR
jgi:peptide/nickel transport system substrate-binding protein